MFGKKKQDDDITSLITGGKVKSKPKSQHTEQPQQQETKKPITQPSSLQSQETALLMACTVSAQPLPGDRPRWRLWT